jgi:hypothetical protein
MIKTFIFFFYISNFVIYFICLVSLELPHMIPFDISRRQYHGHRLYEDPMNTARTRIIDTNNSFLWNDPMNDQSKEARGRFPLTVSRNICSFNNLDGCIRAHQDRWFGQCRTHERFIFFFYIYFILMVLLFTINKLRTNKYGFFIF